MMEACTRCTGEYIYEQKEEIEKLKKELLEFKVFSGKMVKFIKGLKLVGLLWETYHIKISGYDYGDGVEA